MRVVVTGGAGFIGSHIADILVKDGLKVTVFDNLTSGKMRNVNHKAEFCKTDIRYEKAFKLLKKIKPDYIVHEAAQISVYQSVISPAFDADINIMGTLNLLEYARLNGLKKFIFASSGGTVYGDPARYPCTEKYKFDPMSPYGISKTVVEYYLRFYYNQYKIPYTALRYSNVYGPRQDPHGEAGVVAIFTKLMLSGKAPRINGDGKFVRDYVYCEDEARANLLALKSRFIGGLNIGTGTGTDVNQLYKLVAGAADFTINPKHGPARPGDIRKNILSNKFAGVKLGWKPEVKMNEGIKNTVEFFRNNKDF